MIHGCLKDCMLYWGEDANRNECKTCHTSRQKKKGRENASDHDLMVGERQKKLSTKFFRYFPLIPRSKRMLMSSKETKSMVWHGEKNNNDEVMRHPRDPEAWKTFDLRYLNFASDPQNV